MWFFIKFWGSIAVLSGLYLLIVSLVKDSTSVTGTANTVLMVIISLVYLISSFVIIRSITSPKEKSQPKNTTVANRNTGTEEKTIKHQGSKTKGLEAVDFSNFISELSLSPNTERRESNSNRNQKEEIQEKTEDIEFEDNEEEYEIDTEGLNRDLEEIEKSYNKEIDDIDKELQRDLAEIDKKEEEALEEIRKEAEAEIDKIDKKLEKDIEKVKANKKQIPLAKGALKVNLKNAEFHVQGAKGVVKEKELKKLIKNSDQYKSLKIEADDVFNVNIKMRTSNEPKFIEVFQKKKWESDEKERLDKAIARIDKMNDKDLDGYGAALKDASTETPEERKKRTISKDERTRKTTNG